MWLLLIFTIFVLTTKLLLLVFSFFPHSAFDAYVSKAESYLGPIPLDIISLLSTLLTWSNPMPLPQTSSDFLIIFDNNKVKQKHVLGTYAILSDNHVLEFYVLLDLYAVLFAFLTAFIGFWATIYAKYYMANEPRILLFVILLHFFLLSMVLLLTAGNFVTLMLGWELIGTFSFLLINFWNTRIHTFKSALKAFVFNKLSDVGLLMSFVLLVTYLPNSAQLNFENIDSLHGLTVTFLNHEFLLYNLFLLCLVISSFCKSA